LAAAREDVRARLGHLQRHHDADMERLHRESQDRESAALSAYARAVRGMRSLKQTNDGLRQCILAIGADVGRSAAARALLLPHSIPVDVARGVVAPASQTTSAPAHAYDSDSAGAQANAATDLLTLMTSSPRVSAAGSDGVPTRDETSSWSTDTAMSASTSSRGRRASIGPIPHHSSSSSSSSSSKSSSAGPTACLTGHATTTSSATVEPAAPCLHSRVITAARLADADESSSKVGGIVARIQELRQVRIHVSCGANVHAALVLTSLHPEAPRQHPCRSSEKPPSYVKSWRWQSRARARGRRMPERRATYWL